MNNVISLVDKTEFWRDAYLSPDNDLHIKISNNGRLRFIPSEGEHNAHVVVLETVEAVKLLTNLSKQIEVAINELYIDNTTR
jgi:hypothetical protein